MPRAIVIKPPKLVSSVSALPAWGMTGQQRAATRVREREMRRFKSVGQAQRFLNTHAAVYNLLNLGRYLVSAGHYRDLGISAFAEWSRAVA
jgi:putative transposase